MAGIGEIVALAKGLGGSGGGGGSSLPSDPAQDGTYNLQNTVSSGTGTLSWASGSSGGVLVVNVSYDYDTDVYTCDKTASKMWSAFTTGIIVFSLSADGTEQKSVCTMASYGVDGYAFDNARGDFNLVAENGTDYPESGGLS